RMARDQWLASHPAVDQLPRALSGARSIKLHRSPAWHWHHAVESNCGSRDGPADYQRSPLCTPYLHPELLNDVTSGANYGAPDRGRQGNLLRCRVVAADRAQDTEMEPVWSDAADALKQPKREICEIHCPGGDRMACSGLHQMGEPMSRFAVAIALT